LLPLALVRADVRDVSGVVRRRRAERVTVAVELQRYGSADETPTRVERPTWEVGYATLLVVVDALAVTIAAFVALRTRVAATPSAEVGGLSYQWITATFAPAWVLLMATGRA
jgi:hypothetical protein